MREDRFYKVDVASDQRRPFQIDRDRVQYSSAFHRLAGVTQIVRAGEAGVFHTRQQHTYKVAQVGRRLAEYCHEVDEDLSTQLGIDPEVVEAASLAHDLGHPPFGHAGEYELRDLVEKHGDPNGFEGNAQTFRILTKLSVRYVETPGLNLTRATLAATLKYPWLRNVRDASQTDKWGAYDADEEDFRFARDGHDHFEQCPEAALMDWADDISYSVHDLEDFHRVGAIPWMRVMESSEILIARTMDKWFEAPVGTKARLEAAFDKIVRQTIGIMFGPGLFAPFDGSRDQRVTLRNLTSLLIGRFIRGTRPANTTKGVEIDPDIEAEVKLLKQIAKDYITSSPALVAQQHGQRKLIREIFEALLVDKPTDVPKFLPAKLRYIYEVPGATPARIAADCISSLTEHEVVAMHGRLFGSSAGSVLDPIVR